MYIPTRGSGVGNGICSAYDDAEDVETWIDEAPNFLRSRSNIARIDELIGTDGPYSERAAQLMVSTDPGLIDREALKSVVAKQRVRMVGCLSLPFSVCFFLLFAFSTYMHEDITQVYIIESGIRQLMKKTGRGEKALALKDVNSIPDVWDWLNSSLIPNLFVQHDSVGRDLDKNDWSNVLMFNQLQGPLLLEQLRSKKQSCTETDDIFTDMFCYPEWTNDDATFGRNLAPEDYIAAPSPGEYANYNVTLDERIQYYQSSFSVSEPARRLRMVDSSWKTKAVDKTKYYQAFMYPNTQFSLIMEHLTYLKENGWLDAQSKVLTVRALFLNVEVGRPRIEHLTIEFIFGRGGGVLTRLELSTVFLRMFPTMSTVACDFVWLCGLIFISLKEIVRMRAALKNKVLFRRVSQYKNLLELMIIIGGWGVVFTYAFVEFLTMALWEHYEDVIENQLLDVPADLNDKGLQLLASARAITDWTSLFRPSVAQYHLLLTFRFFTAFGAQPRLAIVVGTLESSFMDIFHFILVLIPTFMAYTIAGWFIFGRRMEEFSTLTRSIGVCFKMLMEGEYDWPMLSLEHYWTQFIWTWSFMMLLVLLMMNMVLAIIMDVYAEMRKRSGNSEPVWATVRNLVMTIRNYKRWVSNKDLMVHVKSLNRLVTRADLQEAFPGMCQAQLDMLIYSCGQESEFACSFDSKDSTKLIFAVKMCIDSANAALKELTQQFLDEKTKSVSAEYAPAQNERGWLQEISERMAVQNHRLLATQWLLQQVTWQCQTLEALRSAASADEILGNLPELNLDERDPDKSARVI